MAVEADELLHAELDRQLAEVRTVCDGLATRSGLLIAAVAAESTMIVKRLGSHQLPGEGMGMAEALAKETRTETRDSHARWMLLRAGIGRVSRWMVCSVLLATAPILLSFLALPKSSSIMTLLSHGDFAVLASALAATSIGELIGPTEPVRWVRNILLLASVTLFTFTIVLLAGIAGGFARLSPPLDASLSMIAFGIAAVIGVASWGATVERATESGHDYERRSTCEADS